jgi:hypothetical protein
VNEDCRHGCRLFRSFLKKAAPKTSVILKRIFETETLPLKPPVAQSNQVLPMLVKLMEKAC